MAKKFVRGITSVKNIENFDTSLTNVNDIISDGQNTYVHTKKGNNELYYKLTDKVTSIKPTGNTISVEKSDDGTVSLKTNPKKVLEHEKLKTGDGLTTSFNTDETTIMFKATKKPPETNLNTLGEGVIRGNGFSIDQVPSKRPDKPAAYVTINTSGNTKVQFYIRESGLESGRIRLYNRFINNDEPTEWKEMVGDSGELNNLLAQKQNTLTSNSSIAVLSNNSLRQLFYYKKTYTVGGSYLKTYVKSLAQSTSINTPQDEYTFNLRIQPNTTQVVFNLNKADTNFFKHIIGDNMSTSICGCVCSLNESTLTVTIDNSSNYYIVSFSTIIE